MPSLRLIPIALALALAVVSCTERTPVAPVNAGPDGVAIKGYDPVAYFTDGMPRKGSADFEYRWTGAVWRFASAEHMEMFKTDTRKYAPRYGGYCAYAVSQGKTADIDPMAWTVFEGRLYLNLNSDVQRLWERGMKEYIREADAHWPLMTGQQKSQRK